MPKSCSQARDYQNNTSRLKYFCVSLLVLSILSCSPLLTKEEKNYRDIETTEMRHGLTIFTGPKRTVVSNIDENSVRRGLEVFKQNCQKCHGPDGRGEGPLAVKQGLNPANLKAIANQLPNHYLVIQINQGRSGMPQWKDLLSSAEIRDVTNYIQSLQDLPSKK